ncbi:hypothetical protein [Wukongibacter baidiensis]
MFKKIFEFIKRYYNFSVTSKMTNSISNTMRSFFVNSFIYRLFVNENRNSRNYIKHSLIGRSESLLQKIVSFLNPFYRKGVQGSFVLKKRTINKSNRIGVVGKLVSLMIVGGVLSYNLLNIINRSFYLLQIYISIAIIILAINIYFIDIDRIYKNSLIKRIFDCIFHI